MSKKRPRPDCTEAPGAQSPPDPEQVPSKRRLPEPRPPVHAPPPPHHQLTSERLNSPARHTVAPDARQSAISLPANTPASMRPAVDTVELADRNSRQPSAAHTDAERPAAHPSGGGLWPQHYSRAASAAASLLTAGRSAASTFPHNLLTDGAAAQTGREQQPAAAPPPAAAAGPSAKPGRASLSGIPPVDVVPESPEVGSEEGSPYAAATTTAAASVASAKPVLCDGHPATSIVQARGNVIILPNSRGVQQPASEGAPSPATLMADSMAGGAVSARAAPGDESTPPPKRAHPRPAPTASRLSRGSGVHRRSPPNEATTVTDAAAALQPVASATHHPVPGAWHQNRDGAIAAEREAAAPAVQTPPVRPEAPGAVAAPGIIRGRSSAQHPLPAGNGIVEAAASLTLRLSEPDEHSTPVLAGSAAQRAPHSAAATAARGAQSVFALHTQAPSAPQGTALEPPSAEHTPEPAARLGLALMPQPPSSGGLKSNPESNPQTPSPTPTLLPTLPLQLIITSTPALTRVLIRSLTSSLKREPLSSGGRRTDGSADGRQSSSDMQLAQREAPPPTSTGASHPPQQPLPSTSPAKSDR